MYDDWCWKVSQAQKALEKKPRKIPRGGGNHHSINSPKLKRAKMLLFNQESRKEQACGEMFVSNLAQERVHFSNGLEKKNQRTAIT